MHRVGAPIIFVTVLCAGLIQAGAFDYISLFGVKPDLLLAITVFFSLCCAGGEFIKAALFAGLVKDITSSSVFGSYTASFLLIALLLHQHQLKFYKERFSTQILVTLFSYILITALVSLMNLISGEGAVPWHMLLGIAVKGAIYTGAITPVVFLLLSKGLRVDIVATR